MTSNLDSTIEKLWRCELVSENEVRAICCKCREILIQEGNVQRVDLPVTVRDHARDPSLLKKNSTNTLFHEPTCIQHDRSAETFTDSFTT